MDLRGCSTPRVVAQRPHTADVNDERETIIPAIFDRNGRRLNFFLDGVYLEMCIYVRNMNQATSKYFQPLSLARARERGGVHR